MDSKCLMQRRVIIVIKGVNKFFDTHSFRRRKETISEISPRDGIGSGIYIHTKRRKVVVLRINKGIGAIVLKEYIVKGCTVWRVQPQRERASRWRTVAVVIISLSGKIVIIIIVIVVTTTTARVD